MPAQAKTQRQQDNGVAALTRALATSPGEKVPLRPGTFDTLVAPDRVHNLSIGQVLEQAGTISLDECSFTRGTLPPFRDTENPAEQMIKLAIARRLDSFERAAATGLIDEDVKLYVGHILRNCFAEFDMHLSPHAANDIAALTSYIVTEEKLHLGPRPVPQYDTLRFVAKFRNITKGRYDDNIPEKDDLTRADTQWEVIATFLFGALHALDHLRDFGVLNRSVIEATPNVRELNLLSHTSLNSPLEVSCSTSGMNYGSNTYGCCFMCGNKAKEPTQHSLTLSASVPSRPEGELALTFFNSKLSLTADPQEWRQQAGIELYFRPDEPRNIQLTIGACKKHRQQLIKLGDLMRENGVISSEIIKTAKKYKLPLPTVTFSPNYLPE